MGRYRSLGALLGEDLGRLRPAARRRLAAVLLARPRIRRVRLAGSPFHFLALARPPGAVMAQYHRSGVKWAVAAAGGDGRSLAVAVLRGEGVSRVEAYGGQEADDVLRALLADWWARGRPDESGMRVTATFFGNGGDEPARTAVAWPQPSMVSARR